MQKFILPIQNRFQYHHRFLSLSTTKNIGKKFQISPCFFFIYKLSIWIEFDNLSTIFDMT